MLSASSSVRIKSKKSAWRNRKVLSSSYAMGTTYLDSSFLKPKYFSDVDVTTLYTSPYDKIKLGAAVEKVKLGAEVATIDLASIIKKVTESAAVPSFDLQSIIDELVGFVKNAGSSVVGALNGLANTATSTVEETAEGIQNALLSLKDAAEKELLAAFSEAVSLAKQAGVETLEVLKKAANLALQQGENLSNTVIKTGENAMTTMTDIATSTATQVQSAGLSIVREAKDALKTELLAYKKIVDDKIREIVERLGKTAESIIGTMDASKSKDFFKAHRKMILALILMFALFAISSAYYAIYLKNKK